MCTVLFILFCVLSRSGGALRKSVLLLLLQLLLLYHQRCCCYHDNNYCYYYYYFSSVLSFVRLGLRGNLTIQQISFSSLLCGEQFCFKQRCPLRYCPSNMSFAPHGVVHPPTCPGERLWRGCHGLRHARALRVSVS